MPRSAPHAYRPCVGAMILNREGLAWIGKRRLEGPGSENFAWQMPQGGLDPGEDPLAAARREVHEETGIRSLDLLAEAPDWYSYDLPAEVLQSGPWKGKYRGQTQKWFAFRFTGDDSEIDVANPPTGAEAEFVDWRWERIERLPELIIPFKRAVYEEVVAAFAHLADAE